MGIKPRKLTDAPNAASPSLVATLPASPTGSLPSELFGDNLTGLTGIAFDNIGNTYVAEAAPGTTRIYKLGPSAPVDQSAAVPWMTLQAPVMGITQHFLGGNSFLRTATPQEGIAAVSGLLDSAVGFQIQTADQALTSLGNFAGRLMGTAPAGVGEFYMLSSPAIGSTAILKATNNAWKRYGAGLCCGGNHPIVDNGTLVIPSYFGTLGVRTLATGGGIVDYTGPSFGAMSGVAINPIQGGYLATSLGGGASNAPLLRFGPSQAVAVPLDNWPYEPSF